MKSHLRCLLVVTCLVVAVSAQGDCTGCGLEDQTWGGGSSSEVWTWTPGPETHAGTCNGNCTWSACSFKGTIKLQNNGAQGRDVKDSTNTYKDTVAAGGSKTWNTETISSGCGEAPPPWWHAEPVGGGAATSGYLFKCEVCAAPPS